MSGGRGRRDQGERRLSCVLAKGKKRGEREERRRRRRRKKIRFQWSIVFLMRSKCSTFSNPLFLSLPVLLFDLVQTAFVKEHDSADTMNDQQRSPEASSKERKNIFYPSHLPSRVARLKRDEPSLRCASAIWRRWQSGGSAVQSLQGREKLPGDPGIFLRGRRRHRRLFYAALSSVVSFLFFILFFSERNERGKKTENHFVFFVLSLRLCFALCSSRQKKAEARWRSLETAVCLQP